MPAQQVSHRGCDPVGTVDGLTSGNEFTQGDLA